MITRGRRPSYWSRPISPFWSSKQRSTRHLEKATRSIVWTDVPAGALLTKNFSSAGFRTSRVVVYGNDPDRPFLPPVIVVGAKVCERQIIFDVREIDGPMRVNIKVPEAEVGGIKPELAARIHVDAFPGEILTGKVESINRRPDPSRMFRSDITVYTTRVSIDKGQPGLRPGMTGQVEVLVNEFENLLTVPRDSVLHFDGKDHVAVKKPDGGSDWREVALGVSNDTSVEVKQGLRSGEAVIQNPRKLLSAEEKLAKLGAPAPPADNSSVPR